MYLNWPCHVGKWSRGLLYLLQTYWSVKFVKNEVLVVSHQKSMSRSVPYGRTDFVLNALGLDCQYSEIGCFFSSKNHLHELFFLDTSLSFDCWWNVTDCFAVSKKKEGYMLYQEITTIKQVSRFVLLLHLSMVLLNCWDWF